MIAQEIIAYADMVYPNVNTQEEKLHWLWQFDVLLKKQMEHLGLFSNEIPMYDAQSELLIEDLYSNIYVLYLSTHYNFYNGDLERYNESVALFNYSYGRYLDSLAERRSGE